MNWLTDVRNKVLATGVRYMTSRAIETHQDEVLQVPSRDEGRTIKVHVYKSKNPSQPSPVPVLINFHGSGFVIPMHGSDDEFAMRIAKDTNYTVLDVQYRLAPECPFPSGAHDAEDVVRYVLSKPQEYDLDRVAVSGFSAGGNFALGLSGHVFPTGTFRHVLAYYPPTDLSKDPRTKVAPDTSGEPIPPWVSDVFNSCYLPDGVDRAQPLVSPYYIEGQKFPDSMLVITCAQDNLALETEELVKKIQAAPGKHVEHKRVELCGHAWDKSYKPGTPQEKNKDGAYDIRLRGPSIMF
jgi:acetyl esterase/lipase